MSLSGGKVSSETRAEGEVVDQEDTEENISEVGDEINKPANRVELRFIVP